MVLEYEYFNPLAGLAMIIIGMIVAFVAGLFEYGIIPIIVGIIIVIYYRKYLYKLLMGI